MSNQMALGGMLGLLIAYTVFVVIISLAISIASWSTRSLKESQLSSRFKISILQNCNSKTN